MNEADELRRQHETLRERLSRLSEAALRINEDLDTVLQGVVDGTRSLTSARTGGITVLDDKGELQDFSSSGLTAEEPERFIDLPGGPEFFAYLSSRPNRSGSRISPSTPHRWANFDDRQNHLRAVAGQPVSLPTSATVRL